jgi:hypothetical protein
MDAPGPRRAWLLMTTDGGSVYDDQLGIEYLYDSKVQNHKGLQVGDPIALWDGDRLLGVSVIEQTTEAPGTKTMQRCPVCGKTRPNRPSKARPKYRCSNAKCRSDFDTPHLEKIDVTMYAARYDAAWTSLDGLLDQDEIRPFILKSGSFNSVREIDWPAFQQALVNKDADRALHRMLARVPDLSWPPTTEPRIEFVHGFEHSIVRVRRGQRDFRKHILASQGSNCAFTGAAPPRVLEAGHLYSYAQLGKHDEHGGLMLRRDIHRLFDDGLLSVNPARRRIDVASDLADYPQYATLHGQPLTTQLHDRQVEWLDKHWYEHREAPQLDQN